VVVVRDGVCDGADVCDWVELCEGALVCGADGALGAELVFFWPHANAGTAIKIAIKVHLRKTFPLRKLITAS
jgi:hypothetical protein